MNPQSDPMSIACNERNRTAPLQGAANPYGADTLQGHKILLHIHPAAEQRHIPRPTEQNIIPDCNSLRIVAYSTREDGDFQRFPCTDLIDRIDLWG